MANRAITVRQHRLYVSLVTRPTSTWRFMCHPMRIYAGHSLQVVVGRLDLYCSLRNRRYCL